MTMLTLRSIAAALLVAVAAVLPARAELTRIGPEVGIATDPFPRARMDPAVSMDTAGGFVVVWQSYGPTPDGSGTGVLGRRFDAASAPLGPQFLVNSYTTGSQFAPAIAGDASGRFTVSWTSGSYSTIGAFVQPFDASGSPIGPEAQANTFTPGQQRATSVAMDAAGNFVVVWESATYAGPTQDGDGPGIFAQRYDGTGTRVGGEFQVNTYTTGNQFSAAVAMDSSGGFVVAWTSGTYYNNAPDGSGYGVFARRFASTGTPLGGEFQVNTYTTGNQEQPAVAVAPDGTFVVVWESGDYYGPTQDGSRFGIFGRRFDATGTALGPDFQVNTYTTGSQADPALAMDAAGNFVVAWESDYYSQNGIFAQHFTGGLPDGPEFQVSTPTTAFPDAPAVAAGADGRFVFAWNNRTRFSSTLIAQRFRAIGPRRIIVGSKLRLDDDADATLRRLLVRSADAGIVLGDGNGSEDDPTLSGGHLRVRSATFDDTYELPAANWQTIGPPGANLGYVYRDPFLFAGPVTAVKIRTGQRLRIWAKGSQLGHTLATNPYPVTVTLEIGEFGHRYCMTFGGVGAFKPGRRFRAHGAPAACP
jgi:hypothetical protein